MYICTNTILMDHDYIFPKFDIIQKKYLRYKF